MIAPPTGITKFKKFADFPLDNTQAKDFPVVMHISEKFGMLLCASKLGYLYVYEIKNAVLLYKNKISQGPIFVGAVDRA